MADHQMIEIRAGEGGLKMLHRPDHKYVLSVEPARLLDQGIFFGLRLKCGDARLANIHGKSK